MNDRQAAADRAITGSLVDARNVGAHKSFRLIVDVPAELAMDAINAFGWPSMVSPVPVAVAGLERAAAPVEQSHPPEPQPEQKPASEALSGEERHARAAVLADARRREEASKPKGGRLARQAGILCQDKRFQHFLSARIGSAWSVGDPELTAHNLKTHLNIQSRTELDHDPEAAKRWRDLHGDYQLWLACP